MVQETILQAHAALDQFRGTDDDQFAAWLRAILCRNLAHQVRDFGRAKRDVGREHHLQNAVDASSARLEAWLADDRSSPSQRMNQEERRLRLTEALETLPDAQREAVELYYLAEMPVSEIASVLERSPAAVGGLLHRGLKSLRSRFDDATGV